MKNMFFAILMVLFVQNAQASCHVSDCDDKEFIELGKKFPTVGYFSNPSEGGIFGSGTLVDLDIPKYKGKIVMTCAHIFYDPTTDKLKDSSSKDITFTLENEPPISGVFYTHPLFEENHNHSYDIAIFILDKSIESILPTPIDWGENFESLLKKNYISAGFGITGHVLGKHSIFDLNRRASYAHAHFDYNPQIDVEIIITSEKVGQFSEKKLVEPKGSQLNLCPYVSSPVVNENNTLETWCKPAGITDSADSGGGCFKEDGKLVGVISNGSGFITSDNFSYTNRVLVLEQAYFSKFEAGLEKKIVSDQQLYEKLVNDFKQNNQEEELHSFLLYNPTPPSMPKVVDCNEIEELLKPCYDLKLFDTKTPTRLFLSVSHRTTLISFHKEWLMSILNN